MRCGCTFDCVESAEEIPCKQVFQLGLIDLDRIQLEMDKDPRTELRYKKIDSCVSVGFAASFSPCREEIHISMLWKIPL
jgi:hypothetical protein